MEKKSIQFILANQSVLSKDGKRKEMQVARATGRRRVNFRSFCERVGKSTSFTWQEVGAVLNFAIEIAKDIVSEGDIVEFGDLGTLRPTFKSKAIPVGETFRAQEHILNPRVGFTPNRRYFTLANSHYEQVKGKAGAKAKAVAVSNKPQTGNTEEDNLI